MPKSSAHYLLVTLIETGYVRRQGRRFLPGLRFEMMNSCRERDQGSGQTVRALMTELTARTGGHATLWTAEEGRAVLVACTTSDAAGTSVEPVERYPSGSAAPIRVLAAVRHLEANSRAVGTLDAAMVAWAERHADQSEVRYSGHLDDVGETAPGCYTVAVPVPYETRAVPFSLAVSVPEARVSEERLRFVRARLAEAARAVARCLGSQQERRRRNGRHSRPVIAWSMGQLGVSYYARIMREALAFARAHDVEILWAHAFQHPEKQALDVDQLLDAHPDLVIVHPADPAGSSRLFDRVAAAGVPAICFQRPSRTEVPLTFVGGDVYAAGRLQILTLARALGRAGRVVLLGGDPDNPNTSTLRRGWMDELAIHPRMSVVGETSVPRCHPTQAAQQMRRLYTECRADGVVTATDAMAAAAIAVLESLGGSPSVLVVGTDGDHAALYRIKQGQQFATIFLDPAELCRATLGLAADLLRGRVDASELPWHPVIRGSSPVRARARLLPYRACTWHDYGFLDEHWSLQENPGPMAAGSTAREA